jgi:hypothetical protein
MQPTFFRNAGLSPDYERPYNPQMPAVTSVGSGRDYEEEEEEEEEGERERSG